MVGGGGAVVSGAGVVGAASVSEVPVGAAIVLFPAALLQALSTTSAPAMIAVVAVEGTASAY
jgi:hypothetical protein